MFTAAVIYQLQEEGKLSTSDLVSKYLPDEIALWEGAEAITIDMLLSHTSGLPDYLNSKNPSSVGAGSQLLNSGTLETAFTPQELVANAANDPLLFAPGAAGQWAYSNTGYIMLGQIIEQVSGQSYIDAVTDRIIKPLGLEHTVLVPGIAPAELGLTGQYLLVTVHPRNFSLEFQSGVVCGDGVSTAEDMAIFLRALFSGALYQDPATLDAMLTRAAPGYDRESDEFYYMRGSYYKSGFLGHGGQTLGTESDMGYYPKLDTVIVTWANSSEAFTGRGIFHIGHALGITPSWDDVFGQLPFNQAVNTSTVTSLSIEDVTGITFNAVGVYLADTQEFKAPAEGSTYSLTFNEDGQITFVADCNTVMASYTTGADNAISLQLGASTKVACPPESIADDFLAVLAQASSINLVDTGDQISVNLAADNQSNVAFIAAK